MGRDIRSILVTGGTGSFARAFCRYALQYELSDRICIFSRGEHAQARMRSDLADDGRMRWFIGDIRDADRLREAMDGVDLVVHAAALKRIEVGRYNPKEMIRTNVDGALNIVTAACRAHVDKVVGLSTDKAFQPVSPYGLSKAMMEYIMLTANETVGKHGPTFAITRYGNVWGSEGSVLPTWLRLLDQGATELPVTDLECTRFFMSLEEAVQLVVSTAQHMTRTSNFAVPELPAYRLGDLIEALGATARVTGLPAYEKQHESMTAGNSSDLAPRLSVEELRFRVKQFQKERRPQ